MKHMKYGLLVAGLSLMLGVTSCLDGGDNSTTVSYYEIVKKDALTGTYTSQMGYKVAPLNPQDLEDLPWASDYIQLYYSYDYGQDMSGGEIDANVYGYSLIREGQWLPQSPAEGDANAPISDVVLDSGNKPYDFFYKQDDIFLPIELFVRKEVDTNDLEQREAEMAQHEFALYYDADKDFSESGMTLYLRHKMLNVEEDDEFTQLSGGWWHFNIIDAMARYQEKYSKRPDKITISFERNTKDVSYADNLVSEGKEELDYQKIVEFNEALSESKGISRLLRGKR